MAGQWKQIAMCATPALLMFVVLFVFIAATRTTDEQRCARTYPGDSNKQLLCVETQAKQPMPAYKRAFSLESA